MKNSAMQTIAVIIIIFLPQVIILIHYSVHFPPWRIEETERSWNELGRQKLHVGALKADTACKAILQPEGW